MSEEQSAAKVISIGEGVDLELIQQILDGEPILFLLDDGMVIDDIKAINHCRSLGDEAVFSIRTSKRPGLQVPVRRIVEVHLAS